MASPALSFFLTSSLIPPNPNPNFPLKPRTRICRRARALIMATKMENSPQTSPKLVTFIGKGGSGKTTSAILAAQHYAKVGLNTRLLIHSQDPTAEYLLGCKIGTSPTICNNRLSAVRLETSKMLLEPLNQLKQADARLNLTQGVLEGVVGEELGVLPGMDSIFSAMALEKLIGFLGVVVQRSKPLESLDIIVYDGINTEETLRMIGAAERARWYLKYLRNMAEKTDIGRLTAPSLLQLADEAMRLSGGGSHFNGKMSAEIWNYIERILERASAAFDEPSKFGCFLVMDPNNPMSVNSALRYWGCAIQAGAHISGAFGFTPQRGAASADVAKNFSPLPFALMPYLPMSFPVDWDAMVLKVLSEDAQNLLTVAESCSNSCPSSIKFDPSKKTVTLFMPGFDKSEIKLYQVRTIVEAQEANLKANRSDLDKLYDLPNAIVILTQQFDALSNSSRQEDQNNNQHDHSSENPQQWPYVWRHTRNSIGADLNCWWKQGIKDESFICLLEFKERWEVPSLQIEVL